LRWLEDPTDFTWLDFSEADAPLDRFEARFGDLRGYLPIPDIDRIDRPSLQDTHGRFEMKRRLNGQTHPIPV